MKLTEIVHSLQLRGEGLTHFWLFSC